MSSRDADAEAYDNFKIQKFVAMCNNPTKYYLRSTPGGQGEALKDHFDPFADVDSI